MQSPWYLLKETADIDSPALLVYPQRVQNNINLAIQLAGSPDRLRPHVKTHKSPAVCRLLLNAGIRRFKCATIAEAEMLAQQKAPDVLMAYQPTGPKLKRLARLMEHYPDTRWSCLIDNFEAASQQSEVFASFGWQIPVLIDLNLGMNRTGIAPGAATLRLYEACSSLPGIRIIGLHAYDGHLRDRDIEVRRQRCDEAFSLVEATASDLKSLGLQDPLIVAGGSPTFPIHARRTGVECSPGTFVYWDKGYGDGCPEQPFEPAAVLLTRIISLPAPGLLCTDLGHKSVAAENELSRRAFFPQAEDLEPVSQSEEHLVLKDPQSRSWHTGDCLYAIPYHICPTVALYERVLLVEDGRLAGEWMNTARDRKINY